MSQRVIQIPAAQEQKLPPELGFPLSCLKGGSRSATSSNPALRWPIRYP